MSSRVVRIPAELRDGEIHCSLPVADIRHCVMERKQVVVLKQVFDPALLGSVRQRLGEWQSVVPAAPVDDFRANYHRQRAMVSRLQQAPHVFHDFNFNALEDAPAPLQHDLRAVFDPLRRLYNQLTDRRLEFERPQSGPYLHPQIIHYPNGGGFFGRHWHNLQPQQLGFIAVLSRHGQDYPNGATVFDIDGEVVDLEGEQGLGDICIWRYDYPHWVTQSALEAKFDWAAADGRWVATLAYFDPHG